MSPYEQKLSVSDAFALVTIRLGRVESVLQKLDVNEIASNLSSKVIFTSDNPRFEDPEIIIEEMISGVKSTNSNKTVSISNRKEAIKAACQFARTNDIILVAGKGHESYQEVKGVRSEFDDFEIVKELLNQKK